MMARFADVLTIVNGRNQKKVENPNGRYPIYGSGGVMGYADDYICEGNTVVIGRKGSINNPIFVETPFWNVDTAFGLCADPTKLSAKYLYYFCEKFDFEQLNTTVTIPSLTKTNLLNVQIPLPALDEQYRIVAVLDKVSGLIAKCQVQLDKLNLLVKARFAEIFDLNNCNFGLLRDNTEFIDYRGHTPTLSTDGKIRMVNAKSVGKGVFKYIDEFVSEETYTRWMRRGFACPGDVLFVTEGHTFGNVCQVPKELVKFALGQRVITIQGHKGVLDNTFLCAYMQTDRFIRDINMYKTGGTAQGIRSRDLEKIEVPLCPFSRQEYFGKYVIQVEKMRTFINRSLENLKILKKALMQEYFG